MRADLRGSLEIVNVSLQKSKNVVDYPCSRFLYQCSRLYLNYYSGVQREVRKYLGGGKWSEVTNLTDHSILAMKLHCTSGGASKAG